MPNTHSTLTSLFRDIADSIRNKTGSNGLIVADDFPSAIDAISGGSGGIPEPVFSNVTVTAIGRAAGVYYSEGIDRDLRDTNKTIYIGTTTINNINCIGIVITSNVSFNPLDAGTYIISANYNPIAKMYYIHKNCTITIQSSCFLPDTLITLSDGTKKQAKDITYNDRLKVWNFDEGKFGEANICWLSRPNQMNDHYYKLTFSDGSICKFTGDRSNHKIYNVDRKEFYGVTYSEIGDRIYSENGIVTITNKEYIDEECEYYNLITTGNINCFCNGILSSDRYGNMYPIDEDMKYIKGDRPIRPYSEFEPHQIKRYWYDNLRLGELTDDMNDVINYIGKLECQMLDIERTNGS